MALNNWLIYVVHALAWTVFLALRPAPRAKQEPQAATHSAEVKKAPYAKALVAFHFIGFGLMYFGIGQAVFGPAGAPHYFPFQRAAGALVILTGGALMCWAKAAFRSWRLRAQIDRGHELATGGPFALVRHPIYAGINLMALGSALWLPTPMLFIGALAIIAGSDLRARSEEKVLLDAFGDAYAQRMRAVKRFVPGLY